MPGHRLVSGWNLLAACLMLGASSAAAAACNVSPQGVSFGNYDPLGGSAVDGVGKAGGGDHQGGAADDAAPEGADNPGVHTRRQAKIVGVDDQGPGLPGHSTCPARSIVRRRP